MDKRLYSLNFSSRDGNTHNTIMDLNMSFEDPSKEDLKEHINTWLRAIGHKLEVVDID